MKTEVAYGRTPLGQLVYDLGFTKLSDAYLARKHRMKVQTVRDCRAAFKRGFKQARRRRKQIKPVGGP
jgi:hypothetical protein